MTNDASRRQRYEETQTPEQVVRTYEVYGLRIGSKIPLLLPPSPIGDYDIELRQGGTWESSGAPTEGTLLASVSFGNGQGYTHTATEDGFLLQYNGTAEFRIDRACHVIEAALAPGIAPDYIPILFTGSVLAFVLTIRGEAVLHASAVEVDGEALAFVGNTGMGKSTLAALFCAGGVGLVTDDVLHLDLNGGVACHAGPIELRLREAASELVRWFPSGSCRRTADGRRAVRLPGPARTLTPLRGIVLPRPSRNARDLRCIKLSPLQSFLALTRHPRVLGWKGKEQLRSQVQWHAILANNIPVFEADIPWGPPFAPDLAAHLCQAIGLRHQFSGETI